MNNLGRETDRTFCRTHSWINFALDVSRLSHQVWMLIGEARSKCEHIAGTLLPPEEAKRLYQIYLSKGVHATTSIEGNTLTEEQVLKKIEEGLELPRSQSYLGDEVQNIIDACNELCQDVLGNSSIEITPERICHFNKLVLRGLSVDEDVQPGEIRKHSVTVGNYRGAPAEDCSYLLSELCTWLNSKFSSDDPDMRFAMTLFKAVVAHLYIAWVHPFGDGNGRTARLIEFQIMVQSGLVPQPAGHILSNHYNKTRTRYYQELDRSSKAADGVVGFLRYAIQGFVDGLKEQLEYIRDRQWNITWENYVYQQFRSIDTPTGSRQKHLVLDMPITPTPRKNLTEVSPRVARDYATKGEKTLTRDLNTLIKMKLVIKAFGITGGYKPNRDLIRAFLPPRVNIISMHKKTRQRVSPS
jgi:Fic family protein